VDTESIPPSALEVNPYRRVVSAAFAVKEVKRLRQECSSEEEKKHTEVLAHTMINMWTCPHPNIGFDAPVYDDNYCMCPFSIYNEFWLDAVGFYKDRRCSANKKMTPAALMRHLHIHHGANSKDGVNIYMKIYLNHCYERSEYYHLFFMLSKSFHD